MADYTAKQQQVWMALCDVPCECSFKRREEGNHLSGCYLFDLNIALEEAFASSPPAGQQAEPTTYAEPAADSWTQAERVFWVVFESVAKKHPGLRNVLLGDMVALIEAALAGQHSEQQANPWRQAVDEALIAHALDCTGPGDDPKEKVKELIEWAVTIATDHRVAEQAMNHITDEQIAAAVRPLYADDTAASMGLADDIRTVRAVLALQPSASAEPVAWQDVHDRTNLYYRKPAQGDVRPLFAHPPVTAAREQEADALQWKFECFIDFATGGRLSKSSWALETLKAAVTEYINAEIIMHTEQEASATGAEPDGGNDAK